jgi:hypothetical protein
MMTKRNYVEEMCVYGHFAGAVTALQNNIVIITTCAVSKNEERCKKESP